MTNQQTTDTKSAGANRNAGGPTSEKLQFEIPECCRYMMSQMMTGSGGDLPQDEQEPSTQNRAASPGILSRLMLRMMRACCGRMPAKQKAAD